MIMRDTSTQFNEIINICEELFLKKMHDYGTSWRILRPSSLTDQIYIKANRIRSIQEKGVQKIGDDIRDEFIGIINYATMALIQLELGAESESEKVNLDSLKAKELYEKYIFGAKDLMVNKNHDYGEAWREMRVTSITDIILMKIFRLKQIEDNKGKTLVSEGPEGSYNDIINYAVFAMILIEDENN